MGLSELGVDSDVLLSLGEQEVGGRELVHHVFSDGHMHINSLWDNIKR